MADNQASMKTILTFINQCLRRILKVKEREGDHRKSDGESFKRTLKRLDTCTCLVQLERIAQDRGDWRGIKGQRTKHMVHFQYVLPNDVKELQTSKG